MKSVNRNVKKLGGYKQTKLGCIPVEWEIRQLSDLILEARLGGNYENSEAHTGIPVIKMGNVGRGTINKDKVQSLPENESYNKEDVLMLNDLLFNTRNSLDLVGKVAVWRNELPLAVYNSNLMRMSFHKNLVHSNEFMNYVFNSNYGLNQLRSFATGTTSVAAIYGRDLWSFKILLPPLPEQQKIARILITWDKAIEKTEQLIAQKRQLKKGLMQQLLTGKVRFKKFVKSKKMKKTKLGLIPEEWDVKKGFEISDKITKGSSPNWQGFQYQDRGVLFVTSENVRDGFLDIRHPKYLPFEFDTKLKNSSLNNGDILINIVGASIGRSCIFDNDAKANINQAVCLFRSTKNHSKEFLAYFLQRPLSIDKLLDTQSDSARPNLTLEDIRNFHFPIPPTLEQRRIARVLKLCDQEINALIHSLDGIKNQKKGLMQQLLTGKVRVKLN